MVRNMQNFEPFDQKKKHALKNHFWHNFDAILGNVFVAGRGRCENNNNGYKPKMRRG